MPVSISAALIVRNEQRFLDGCLRSLAGHVAEIVVVDTGSSDETLEIAAAHGAVVLHRKWRDDFAWARNEGLVAAKGEWILYIDADERLSVPPEQRLSDGLDDPAVVAGRVLFRPLVNSTPYREYRLFRNDPRIRFRGAMHETIVPDLQRLEELGHSVVDSAAAIQHLGYEGDQSHKHARNVPLLRAAVASTPERLYYWHHLAETLANMGDVDEAIEVAREAMPRITQGNLSSSDKAVASLLLCTYARALIAKGEDPLAAVDQGLELYPTHAQLLLIKARTMVERGQLAEALRILEGLAIIDGSTFVDPQLSHDQRIFDEFAHDLMGVVLLRMGRRAEAADAFERAAKAAPNKLAYRAKAIAIRPH